MVRNNRLRVEDLNKSKNAELIYVKKSDIMINQKEEDILEEKSIKDNKKDTNNEVLEEIKETKEVGEVQDTSKDNISKDKNDELVVSIPLEWIYVLLFSLKIELGFKDKDDADGLLNIDFFRDKRLFYKFFSKNSNYKFTIDSENENDTESSQVPEKPVTNDFDISNDINHEKGNLLEIFSKETHLIINDFNRFIKKQLNDNINKFEYIIHDQDFNLLLFLSKYIQENKCFEDITEGLENFTKLTKNIKNEGSFYKKKFIGKRKRFHNNNKRNNYRRYRKY